MNEAKTMSNNRCFGGHCPKDPASQKDKQREQQIKDAFVTARQRKNANRAISHLSRQLRVGLAGLLKAVEMQVRRGNFSLYVYEVLIERVEGQGNRNELSPQQIMDLQEAKDILKLLRESK